MVCLNLRREKFNSLSISRCHLSQIISYIYLGLYSNLHTWLFVVSGEKKDAGASSRDGQDTLSQQVKQGDTVETFQQKYLSSGKSDFLCNSLFTGACFRDARIHD